MIHLFDAEIEAARERQRLLLETLDDNGVRYLRAYLSKNPAHYPHGLKNIPDRALELLQKTEQSLSEYLSATLSTPDSNRRILHVFYMAACVELGIRHLQGTASALENKQSYWAKFCTVVTSHREVALEKPFYWPFHCPRPYEGDEN